MARWPRLCLSSMLRCLKEPWWQPLTPKAPYVTCVRAVPIVPPAPGLTHTCEHCLLAAQPLPPGWIMETDADGYSYYVNTLTDASQWERPTEAAVGADGTVAT